MILNIAEKLNSFNESLFSGIDNYIQTFPLPDYALDAIIDTVHTLPFLFLVFLFIELFEYFWADKINHFMKESGKTGPLIGSIAAIIPQCGFSIIASGLYSNKFITKGTIIAIYLATSDEALPILLSYPNKIHFVLPLIITKLVIAILAGYLIDLIFKSDVHKNHDHTDEFDEGCCKHDIVTQNKINLWLHPLAHTLNVGFFIFIITLILNAYITETTITTMLSDNTFLEPVIAGIIGLIPNCAVSVGITMMLGTISFGGAIAGLCSNAGLGLLVLLKRNEKLSDSFLIIFLLLTISILSGIVIQLIESI